MTSQADAISEMNFTIVQGPDRQDITNAFWAEKGKALPNVVRFVTKDGKRDVTFDVEIDTLQTRDNRATTVNIEGYVVNYNPRLRALTGFAQTESESSRPRKRVFVNYNTGQKSGIMKLAG